MKQSKKIKRRVPRRKKQNIILIFFFSSAILLMIFYVWIFNHTNMIIGEIDDLKHIEAHLETQNRILRAEIDNLSRVDRIKELAFLQLEMVTPQPETLAVIIEPTLMEED